VRLEHALVFTVSAWDSNCAQHIPQRLEAAEVKVMLAERDQRIEDLTKELDRLRNGLSVRDILKLSRIEERNPMNIDKSDTAVVFIDPQNEVLSERGLAWPLVRESLHENHTIENMERIFKAAKARGFEVFISPHYFYPTDKEWKFNGPLETDEAVNGYFARKGVLNLDGLGDSGADWLDRFKPYIEDGKTVVVSPHRVWGPETNDLVLQLRKRRIGKIILGGMLANMCVESHLRELLEQGFEVAVVKDATAAPKHPQWGYGYTAALINYAYLAHAVWTTDEAVKAVEHAS
jgi:nicotinamidase-related amidase